MVNPPYHSYQEMLIHNWKPPLYQVNKQIKFLENKKNFKEALKKHDFEEIFTDQFAGLFGHTSKLGHEIIANNIFQYLEEKGINLNH